jgi:hypothetical protein
MENQVQLRDKQQGNILTPPHTVEVSNWKGSGKRARVNRADYDPSRDGNLVPDSEHQHFASEIAAFTDEQNRRKLESDQHKASSGLTGDAA